MAARSVAPKPMSVGPPHVQAEPRDSAAMQPPIVSVSPREADRARSQLPSQTAANFSNDIVKNLSELIDLATKASTRLEEAVTKRADHDRRATRASVHLQERLRLGARMLQAFQDQLARAEQTLINLRSAQQQLQHAADETMAKLRQEFAAAAPHPSASSENSPAELANVAALDLTELDQRIATLREILNQIAARVPLAHASAATPPQTAPVVEIKARAGGIDADGPFQFRTPSRQAAR